MRQIVSQVFRKEQRAADVQQKSTEAAPVRGRRLMFGKSRSGTI